jgi:hypothetical protein
MASGKKAGKRAAVASNLVGGPTKRLRKADEGSASQLITIDRWTQPSSSRQAIAAASRYFHPLQLPQYGDSLHKLFFLLIKQARETLNQVPNRLSNHDVIKQASQIQKPKNNALFPTLDIGGHSLRHESKKVRILDDN